MAGLLKSGGVLGVDIGTTSMKIVEIKPGKAKPAIVNYAVLEATSYLSRANQALQTSGLKIFEGEAVELLKTAVGKMGSSAKNAVASLQPFSAFSVLLDFPQMSADEVAKSMEYQAKQYVPLPLSEVVLDWVKVSEYTDDGGFVHQKLLLIAVPRENIEKYQRIFKAAGLSLKALELENLSIARIFGNDPTPTIIVDVGSFSTNMIFMEGGRLLWGAQSDFASASLTQALAESLSINPIRAEELKRERGIVGGGASYELSTIMLPFIDAIINEVKKAQFTFSNQFPAAKKAERALLSGGGANMLGLPEYFERELGIPVVKATPFTRFEYDPALEPIAAELNPIMSVALGLGIKEFS